MKLKLLFLLIPIFSFSQISFEKVNEKTRKFANNYLNSENIPGMSISVSYNGKTIFSEGFGYADLENKIPVNPSSTKFDIGSVSKVITATTLARLAEMKTIDLDESAYFYLDSLPKKQYDFTVRQVGGHLSGIVRNPNGYQFTDSTFANIKDFYSAFEKDKLLFKPSSKVLYSNLGYRLLGLIIEKQYKKTLTESQKELVLDKLNMTNTIPDCLCIDDKNSAKLYSWDEKDNTEVKRISCEFQYAEGCYLSTTEDLIKLGNALLFPDKLLKKETLVQFILSQKLDDGKKTGYGIGLQSQKDENGNFYYGHAGNWIGSRAFLYVYPNSKLVVTVLANRRFSKTYKDIVPEIAYHYIELLKK